MNINKEEYIANFVCRD